MKGYDLFELAVRNLRQSKLRNGLTTIGISVGVASLVAMLSLGVGLQQLATKRLAGSGMFDTVFVTSKQDFRGFDRTKTRGSASREGSSAGRSRSRADDAPAVCDRGCARSSRDGADRLRRADALRIRHRLADVGAGE